MAAITVSRWAVAGTTPMHIVGDILFHEKGAGLAPKIFITPEFTPIPQNGIRRRTSLWTTGRALLAQAGAPEPEADSTVVALLTAAYAPDGYSFEWDDGQASLTCTAMLRTLAGHTTSSGVVRLEWLPQADISVLQVHARDGVRKSLAAASGLNCKANTLIRDFVTWTRTSTGQVLFHFRDLRAGDTQKQIAEELALVLVINFSGIATRSAHPAEVGIVATPSDHPVVAHLRTHEHAEVMIHSSVIGPPIIQRVTHHGALTTLLTQFMAPDAEVHVVHPHPAMTRLVCLWVGHRRWSRRRGEHKRRFADSTLKRGAMSISARSLKWKELSGAAAAGLATLEWKRIRRIVGMNPWGEQILIRLKHHALSIYDVKNNKMGCPHEQCRHRLEVTLYHVFWECEAAVTLRRHMLKAWKKLGLREAGLESAIFSLRLSEVPSGIWEVMDSRQLVSTDPHLHLAEAITALVQSSWRIGAAIYLQSVWRWRVNHFDELSNVTIGHHTALLHRKLRHGYNTVHHHMQATYPDGIGDVAAALVKRALTDGTMAHDRQMSTPLHSRYILLCGRRTHDKARQAGSGAILLRMGRTLADVEVCWLAHMSYASANITQHTVSSLGLRTGLKECVQKGYSPLHVIADNAQLVDQHRRRKPPLSSHLKQEYWRCRRLANRLTIQGWHHQPRNSNMMVHTLATTAMETKTSRQVQIARDKSASARWEKVLRYLETDMAPWIDQMEDTAQEDAVAASHTGRRQGLGRRKPGPDNSQTPA